MSFIKKLGNAATGIATGGLYTSEGNGLLQGSNPIDTVKSIAGGQTSAEAREQQKKDAMSRESRIASSISSGKKEGLDLANIGYGQGLADTGSDIQRVRELQKARTNQSASDPVTAAIMAQKAGAVANSSRQLASSGVKGGVAAQATEAVSRQRQSDIDASLYGQQRQAVQDERSLAGNTLSGTTSLMFGNAGLGLEGAKPDLPNTKGLTDSVICTELFRQEIMPLPLYLKDSEYGRKLNYNVIAGYKLLAVPVVKLMQRSPLVTSIIKYPAMKWAKHIGGVESSLFGYACQYIGEPTCYILGVLFKTVRGVVYGF
jgi:hypothetical protein